MRLTWQQVGTDLSNAQTPSFRVNQVSPVAGGDAGHVQPVSGGDGPTGLLQVERGHLCFHWPTLELPAGNEEEDVDVVEHGGRMPVRRQSHLLPLWGAGVWRTGLVEAGPEQTSHPETRGGQVHH